jgi:HEAT repeat protein
MGNTTGSASNNHQARQQIKELVKLLLSGKTRADAERKLLTFNRILLVDTLKDLLEDDDLAARDGALRFIVKVAPSEAVAKAITLLHDPMPAWRWYLCGMLADYGDERAVLPLVDVLLHDPDDDTRYTAAFALERIGDTRALPALRQAQQNDQGADYEGRKVATAAADAIAAILQRHPA